MAEFFKVCPLLRGNLYVMPKPGKGGGSVAEGIAALKAEGVNLLVSLLQKDEQITEGLEKEAELCSGSDIQYLNFPIEDHHTPNDREAAMKFIEVLKDKLSEGKSIAIHCKGGVGRTGTLAGALMLACNIEPEEVFEKLSAARGKKMPATEEQRAWVIGE
ncbi:dual specificity protein phosphatase family protein [Puniceicoccaceae bacterium K14]|nr:dual specificity protein phosphatase family protein [Puniceicoccaceae bacterium K14]